MTKKVVTYKEPKSYFSPAMRRAEKEYDRKKAAKEKAAKTGKKSK